MISYRILLTLSHYAAHTLTFAFNDFTEQFVGEVFAFVVSYDSNLYFLVVTEIFVIVHLARHKGVGTLSNSVVKHERPCSATYRHLTYLTLQELVGHNTLRLHTCL